MLFHRALLSLSIWCVKNNAVTNWITEISSELYQLRTDVILIAFLRWFHLLLNSGSLAMTQHIPVDV